MTDLSPTPALYTPPPPAPQIPVTESIEPRLFPFAFTGNAREYFRIWIVNLFLSIVTLGIYSPWAKVRKKRYLYGNSWVADANFEYHGNPLAILKGRIIALLALVAYNLAGHYVPKLGTAVFLALMVAAPWLIVRSLQFNAQNSSYRNLRFHFHGSYGEGLRAVAPLLLSPLLVLVLPPIQMGQVPTPGDFMTALAPTLPVVIFYPYVVGRIRRMHVRNSSYGSAPFAFAARIGQFYKLYVLGGLVLVGAMLGVGLAAGGFVAIPYVPWVVIPAVYILAMSTFFGYTRSRIANVSFNGSSLAGRVRFASRLSARKLAWIYFVNVLAIVFTAGLLVPWAVVRTVKYRAACLVVECADGVEGFLGDVSPPVAATGDQMGEFFDVDLSL